MEKIREACLTELIEQLGASLNESIDLIDERHRQLQLAREKAQRGKATESGPKITSVQVKKDNHYETKFIFQTGEFPTSAQPKPKEDQSICLVTGGQAKYVDPLTKTPFSDKLAFRVIRERFFQKEEERLNLRIHTLNELFNQKRERLKRMQFDQIY